MSVEGDEQTRDAFERRGVISGQWPAPSNGLIWVFETNYAYRPHTRRWRWVARCGQRTRCGQWKMTEAEAVEAALRAGAKQVLRPPCVHGCEGALA